MGTGHRMERVQSVILAELSQLIRSTMPEEYSAGCALTRVEVTRDLSQAKIWLLVHEPMQAEDAVAALQSKAWDFHRHLFKTMHLRKTPVLTFIYDDATEQGIALSLRLGQGLGSKDGASQE